MPHVHKLPQTARLETLTSIFPHAAGLDSGSAEIVAAVPPDRVAQPVCAFGTFTPDVEALVDWLVTCGIDTVAMELTGISWIPIYELLEQRGIVPYLVNARAVKAVPGRKTDWNDAQWLQKLHMMGLLKASFRPDAEMCQLRTLVRYRAALIQHRSPHVLHLQKARVHMNLHVSLVVSDVMGTTGHAMLRAIVAGERDPDALAQYRQASCKASAVQIAKALTGTWKEEYRFIIKQSLALYDSYTEVLALCDHPIEQLVTAMESRGEPNAPLPDLPPKKKDSKSKNAPNCNVRAQLARIVGVDLVAITGLSAATVQTILSEIGTDMSRFPMVKHCCSWLGLAPRHDISGGKVLRSRTMNVQNRAAQALRAAAQAVTRSDSAFGAYYRSMRARLGPQQATVATAHKIARVVYHMLKTKEPFEEQKAVDYDTKRRERELKQLQKRAQKLGYALAPKLSDTATISP